MSVSRFTHSSAADEMRGYGGQLNIHQQHQHRYTAVIPRPQNTAEILLLPVSDTLPTGLSTVISEHNGVISETLEVHQWLDIEVS